MCTSGELNLASDLWYKLYIIDISVTLEDFDILIKTLLHMVVFHYLIQVHLVNQMFFLDREIGDIIGCASAVTKV